MQIRLTYQEISDLIEKKAGRQLPIAYGGPHTVRISYPVTMLFRTTDIGIDLTIDSVDGGNIIISYSGGAGIDFMVKQAINMARNRPGGDMIEPLTDNRLMLCLGKNAQAGSLLDHVTLKDICFDDEFAIVEFVPKNI